MKGHQKINNPMEMWEKKMESKFDVDIELSVDTMEVEEIDEDKEIARECKICENVYVVRKEYEFANEKDFICPYCIFILSKINNTK